MLTRRLAAVVVIFLASGCGGGSGGGGGTDTTPPSSPSGSSSGPAETGHKVPDSSCPEGWTGLTVSTDVEAEVQYLDDITACTDNTASRTYLWNRSGAVWALNSTTSVAAPVEYIDGSDSLQILKATTFRRSIYGLRQAALMVPNGAVVITAPPTDVRWDLDGDLSASWQGQEVVVDELKGIGEAALVARIKQDSAVRAAMAECALSVAALADGVGDLDEPELQDIVLTGLGGVVAGSRCREASIHVRLTQNPSETLLLSDELGRLRFNTEVWSAAEKRISNLSALSKAFTFFRLAHP